MEERGNRDQIVLATKVCGSGYQLNSSLTHVLLVHNRIQKIRSFNQAEGQLFRKQSKINEHLPGLEFEETPNILHRCLLPPLVGLPDLS